MTVFQRRVGLFVLLALLLVPVLLLAQDGGAVTVVGSGTVTPLFEALVEASGADVNLSSTVMGTNAGFDQFCQGRDDVVTANRPISTDESAACQSNNVEFAELLIGHQVVAIIANPATDFIQCLTTANLTAIFAPSAQGHITNWNQVDVNYPNTPLAVFVPPADSSAYAILDNLVGGDALRADAAVQASDADTITAVSQTNGAVGAVSLAAAQAAGDAVKILQLNTNDAVGCTEPSALAVENRQYGASSGLFVYVNRASLEKTGLRDALNFIVSDEAAAVVEAQNFTAPSDRMLETDRAVLEGTQESQFSRGGDQFTIPADISGSVTIAGSASGKDYLDSVTSAFSAAYPGMTVTFEPQGDPAGIRRLCNGEVDMVIADGDLTDEQRQNCQANNITPLPIELGHRATVLVANGSSPYLACLTTNQLATVWGAAGENTVTTWNQVNDQFPETAVTLFAPAVGGLYSDIMMLAATGANTPIRADIQVNADPLYRAAAVANVEGGLALLNWDGYQRVLENNQTNIQLVSVDGGSGCVAPSEETIGDGSYPLTDSLLLIVSEAALRRVEVQSFLWFTFGDQNYTLVQDAGLMGLSFGDLPDVRATLLEAFARAAAPEATPEATAAPEATAEATAEATTGEATLEATVEATPEATPGS
ncbi:MAG: substrate-binding domain-containing protein [Chloroflexi bacterium]|nr:substrate-binding domain-containing protein [Chloroflexota bacterium]